MTGENRARVLFEGSEQDCHDRIGELRDRHRESGRGDSFTIYQLKDDESLHYIRFEGLDRLEKEGFFNALHPLDFRGHSLSVSDVVVLHKGGEDRAFYVDVVGFAELPDFLLEKTAERGAEITGNPQEIVGAFRSETERLFNSGKVDGMRPADIEAAVRNCSKLTCDDDAG